MEIKGGEKRKNGQKMMRKRLKIRKEFKNKGFVLTLFNLKALVLAVLLFPLIGIVNINAEELFVTSRDNNSVLRYNGTTGAFIDDFVPDFSGGLEEPVGLVFGPDGNLYVSSEDSDQVLRYNGTTGAFIDVFASGGGLDFPFGLVFGPDGNLYVSSFDSTEVLRYNGTTGAFIDDFVEQFSGGLDDPTGLVFGPDGNLYVSSADNDRVLRYNGTTGDFINNFASGGGLDLPFGLVFGPDGNLYVSSLGTNEVLRYNGTTGAFMDVFVSMGDGGLDGPSFLVFQELPPRNIPTLSEWGLIVMAGVLGIVGFMVMRRRKVTA